MIVTSASLPRIYIIININYWYYYCHYYYFYYYYLCPFFKGFSLESAETFPVSLKTLVEGASSTTPQRFCIWPSFYFYKAQYIFYAKSWTCHNPWAIGVDMYIHTYYVYMYIHIILCLHVYICIYTERERESKKMQRWTTSDVKKIENVIKTFRSETFSY